jgi:predicted kinase
MTVHIMVGASGSGKSTLARKIAQTRFDFDWPIFSADDAMMVDGVYRFEPGKLGFAHRQCLRGFSGALQNSTVIVDNTNCTVMEAAPYIALALAFGHAVVIHILRVDPAVAHARGTHGVPRHVVNNMAATIEREWPSALPWHWKPENEPNIRLMIIEEPPR